MKAKMRFFIFTLVLVESVFFQKNEEIDLKTIDLTVSYIENDHTVELEAFKSHKNDLILMKNSTKAKLRWYSLGNPTLVSINSASGDLFQFTPQMFYTHVEMLTDRHRQLFVQTIKEEYEIDVQPKQIENIILTKFVCDLALNHENEDKSILRGEVSSFQKYPLELHFEYQKEQKDRNIFMKHYSEIEKYPLIFKCELSTVNEGFNVKIILSTAHSKKRFPLGIDTFL